MDAPRRMPSSAHVLTAGILLTAALVLAQTAGQLIDFHFFDLRLRLLDSDHHASVFGALSILAQAGTAAAIAVRAVSTRRLGWLAIAVPVALLTVPRGLMRYEAVFARHELAFLAAPLTVVFVALCLLTFHDARRFRFTVWGALVLLAASFALHVVGPQADAAGDGTYSSVHTWAYQLAGVLKHSTELAGWMLLATAMIAVATCRTDDAGRGIRPALFAPRASG